MDAGEKAAHGLSRMPFSYNTLCDIVGARSGLGSQGVT
jgi:hypothetical protein